MTTIAYRDGVLAADSLSTSNGLRDNVGRKIWRVGRLLVGAAGGRGDCLRFRAWVAEGCIGPNPFVGSEGGNGLVITPEGQVACWGTAGPWPVTSPFYSLGSGYQIAVGAMEMGASAEEAVRAAIVHDTCSGGPVQTLRLGALADAL